MPDSLPWGLAPCVEMGCWRAADVGPACYHHSAAANRPSARVAVVLGPSETPEVRERLEATAPQMPLDGLRTAVEPDGRPKMAPCTVCGQRPTFYGVCGACNQRGVFLRDLTRFRTVHLRDGVFGGAGE